MSLISRHEIDKEEGLAWGGRAADGQMGKEIGVGVFSFEAEGSRLSPPRWSLWLRD